SPPQVSPPQVSPPQVSPPQVSPPQVSPPQVSPPQVSPPQVSPPQVSPPQALGLRGRALAWHCIHSARGYCRLPRAHTHGWGGRFRGLPSSPRCSTRRGCT